MEHLQRAGADLAQAREIEHYLYFPTEEAARTAAEQLRSDGFTVTVRRGADNVNWLALASQMSVVSDETLDELNEQLAALADSLGGEYDGWQAAAAP